MSFDADPSGWFEDVVIILKRYEELHTMVQLAWLSDKFGQTRYYTILEALMIFMGVRRGGGEDKKIWESS